jgi:hypothetical protein
MRYQLVLRLAVALGAALMLFVPAKAVAAAETPSAEAAVEAVPVDVVPEPEAAPVEASAVTSEAEAATPEEVPVPEELPTPQEASSPEEAPVTEEIPVVEEVAAPVRSALEPQPQLEPQPEPASAEVVDTEAARLPVLDSRPVKAATDLVKATTERLASAGKEAAPIPLPVDVVANPVDLGPRLERTPVTNLTELGAGIEKTLTTLAGSLESPPLVGVLNPVGTLNPNERSEGESLVPVVPAGWAEPTAGSTASASVPGELLPGGVAQLPERRLPSGTDDPQEQGPIATEAVPLSAPAAPEGPGVPPTSSIPSDHVPVPPVFLGTTADEAQAAAAQVASAGRSAGLPSPDRLPSGHLAPGAGSGSGSGGSIFIPLFGALALLALVAPRGYRRRMAVRDFPVPTPFVCALERPG